MAGILFLIICTLTGAQIAFLIIRPSEESAHRCNLLWIVLPLSFGSGILLLGWAVYFMSWFFSVRMHVQTPLFPGNAAVMTVSALILLLRIALRRNKDRASVRYLVSDRKRCRREAFWFGLLFLFSFATMWYVFHQSGGYLYSGVTVYGDYAPHTAIMRSFSRGRNYPTQYPHFGGEDIKYHFMFQFLVGNLEYLGIRMDIAYNLMGALCMTGFLMILCQIALRISGRARCGFFAVAFFVFRSGTTFFRYVYEHLKSGDLLKTLRENTVFIGYTMNENWGLWNYNVYLNQRHLLLGLLIAAAAVWVFMDHVEAGSLSKRRGISFLAERFFSVRAWRPLRPLSCMLMGLLLGLCAFWNGAALIGALLILFGMAVFSDGKTDYLAAAAEAVLLALLQTRLFIRGSGFALRFQWGFISEDKSPAGVIWYLIEISGFVVLGVIVLLFLHERRNRVMMAAFCMPVLFSFTASLTPDITVNHKYIMISWAFLTVFWADAVLRLCRINILSKIAAVFLTAALIATGVYDFVIIIRNNGAGHRVGVDVHSSTTEWLSTHLTSEDLLLSPEYSMNDVTMSGVMLYCGWPYYAWSAGYDTYYRAGAAKEMYSTPDPERLQELVRQENITYILYESDMKFEDQSCREDVIASVYPMVFISENGRMRIYDAG